MHGNNGRATPRTYTHTDCGGTVTKSPCGTSKEKLLYSGLHGWRCDQCNKQGVKVTVKLVSKN